jgi:hypothetical protein
MGRFPLFGIANPARDLYRQGKSWVAPSYGLFISPPVAAKKEIPHDEQDASLVLLSLWHIRVGASANAQ